MASDRFQTIGWCGKCITRRILGGRGQKESIPCSPLSTSLNPLLESGVEVFLRECFLGSWVLVHGTDVHPPVVVACGCRQRIQGHQKWTRRSKENLWRMEQQNLSRMAVMCHKQHAKFVTGGSTTIARRSYPPWHFPSTDTRHWRPPITQEKAHDTPTFVILWMPACTCTRILVRVHVLKREVSIRTCIRRLRGGPRRSLRSDTSTHEIRTLPRSRGPFLRPIGDVPLRSRPRRYTATASSAASPPPRRCPSS